MAVQSGRTRLGSELPAVALPDVDGNIVDLGDLRGDGVLVVMFAANHCPYVQHVEGRLAEVYNSYADRDVHIVGIMSNDVETYPDDDVDGMLAQIQRAKWTFPYLLDRDQQAALTFGAVCTPDFFVYDRSGRLVYRGAFDGSSPKNNEPLTGALLDDAIAKALAGEPVPEPHRPAMGCGIKWLPGNEPETVSLP